MADTIMNLVAHCAMAQLYFRYDYLPTLYIRGWYATLGYMYIVGT